VSTTFREDPHLFLEHFGFQDHSLVNFVGGGGKTALIHLLMNEYCARGPTLYTTTTRIHPPDPGEGLAVISSDHLPMLRLIVERIGMTCEHRSYRLAVTRRAMSPNLLRGVPSDFNNSLDRSLFHIFLNEADGAASFSLKIPREGEPVLMEHAEYLVPVIGLDCLHQPLGPQVLFRWHALARHFDLRAGDPITHELAASILMHREGVCKGWKTGTTIIPFINKVDTPEQEPDARALAQGILLNGNFPVKHVVLGSVLTGRVDSMLVV
jgi:probable selenium-dependent hydroxylase accessory protein YqeC